MGILRLTPTVPEEFECEVLDTSLKEYVGINLVRPCERYLELFKTCKSIRGRLHQYYVYGELFDCQPHKSNYDACMNYRKSGELSILDPIIEWETNMINTRLKTVEQNKVWKMRDSPPEDFNAPLPNFISRRKASELFKRTDEESRKTKSA